MKKLFLFVLMAVLTSTVTAQENMTYRSMPKALKQVVKKERQPRLLRTNIPKGKVRRAPSLGMFQGLTIYVNLTNSDDWNNLSLSETPYGIHTYTIGEDLNFQPIATNFLYNFMASAMGRNEFVGIRPIELFGALQGVEYDGLSGQDFHQVWSQVYNGDDYSLVSSAMAYNPTNGQIFSLQYNSDLTGLNLARWNAETRMFETVHRWNNDFQPVTLAFNPAGRLFAIGADGYYYELDPETGDASMLGKMAIEPTLYVQSMTYDNRSGYFIWMAVSQTGSGIYAVEPETGEATLIRRLSKNEQAASVFFRHEDALAKAPAKVQNLKFNYSGNGQTSGNLTFTVPTNTFDGSALSGEIKMSVWLDGQRLAEDVSVNAGSQQTFSFNLTNDNHYAYVVLKNDVGFSPAAVEYAYAGYDVPQVVTNVSLTINDGTANLTWTAPTGGVNGGYVDFENLTYNIVRMPDSVQVATGIKENTYNEIMPTKLERYYYVVTPVNAGKEGEGTESNRLLAGQAYGVPYREDFSDASTQSLWTVVNANEDVSSWGTVFTWQVNWNGLWNISTSSYNIGDNQPGCDDWLISPGIALEKGITYALIDRLSNSYSNYKERVALLIGTDPTDLSTFRELDKDEAYDPKGTPSDWEVDFQVDQEGIYYFAVHCYTQREDNGSSLTLLSMRIESLGVNGAPAEVKDLKITPEPSGEMQAEIAFTAPDKTLGGDTLTGEMTAHIYRDTHAVAHVNVEPGQQAKWTDTEVEGVRVHTYEVAVSNAAGEGKRIGASAFIGVYTAPYYNTFETADDAQFFTTVNDSAFYSTNEYRWIWDNNGQKLSLGGYGYLVQHTQEKAWLYMPAIRLEANQVYTYAFNWTYSVYNQVNPAFAGIGMAADSTAQTLFDQQLPYTAYGEKVPQEFEVITTETGKYYPSIVVIGNNNFDYLSPSIDDIAITHVGSAFAPYSVENLEVVADATGQLSAVMNFNAPTVDYSHHALTNNMTIHIYRQGSTIPVKTFENVEPGQAITWTDTQPLNGKNAYTVVALNDYGRGKATEVETFVGIDVPMAVRNLRIRGNEDNQQAVITWDAPEMVGQNGGVIDASLEYAIVEYFPEETEQDKQLNVIGFTKETTYTVSREPSVEMEQHIYYVIPQTSAGVGASIGDYIILGQLKPIPFTESFAGGYLSTSGWVANNDGAQYGAAWQMLTDNEEQTAQDEDNGFALCYNGSYMDAYHWEELITPKMQVKPGNNYAVTFYVFTGMTQQAATAPTLVVGQSTDDGDFHELATIDITKGDYGWTKYTLPMTVDADTHHTKLSFRGYLSNMSERLLLDNITVEDITATNIERVATESQNSSQIYDLQGRKRYAPTHGLNLMIGNDGKVSKFIRK